MNFNLNSIKQLLKEYHCKPIKRLGQHFLIDKKALQRIIENANLSSNDVVLEIGPGIGNLTKEIAPKVKKLIVFEKDKRMIKILRQTLKDFKNLKIIQGDILKIKNLKLKNYKINSRCYKIVANLPFYIASAAIRKFLETENQPKEMVLMIQKEVAQRICAKPPKMNLLAVSTQFYAKPEIVFYVSRKSFWPQPTVDSAVLKIIPIPRLEKKDFFKDFFKIVKAGFSQPRKYLINNLSNMLLWDKEKTKNWLLENNIQPEQRPETLNVNDWINLTKSIKI